MQSRGAFPTSEQPGDVGHLRDRIHANAAHEVVKRRPDFHRVRGDVDLGQLFELVIHRGELAFDEVRGPARSDVQEHAAVRRAASRTNFGANRARHDVARQKLGRPARGLVALEPSIRLFHGIRGLGSKLLGNVLKHEALALVVLEHAAIAAHSFGDERSPHRRRPHHSRGMELRELQVHELGAGFVGHARSIAGVFPGIAGDAPGAARAARRQDHRRRTEQNEASGLAPIRGHACNLLAVFQELQRSALHVEADALVHAMILQRADQLQSGSITDVSQSWIAMSAEIALADEAFLGSIEDRAPFLQLHHPRRRFLGMDLRHAPIVQKFSAPHRVAKVHHPIVARIDVAERGGHSAFGHHGVGLAEKALGKNSRGEPEAAALDRGAKSGAPRSDHDHVVLDRLDLGDVHEAPHVLRSWMTPMETRRT